MGVERSDTQYRLMVQCQLIKELKDGKISRTEYKRVLNSRAEMENRIKRLKIKNWQKNRIKSMAEKIERKRGMHNDRGEERTGRGFDRGSQESVLPNEETSESNGT